MDERPRARTRIGRRTLAIGLIASALVVGWLVQREWRGDEARAARVEPARRFLFEYTVDVPPSSEASASPLVLFLPVASDTTGQRIVDLQIESPVEGRIETEEEHGNRYWVAELPGRRADATTIRLRYEVERHVVRAGDERGDVRDARRFLDADQRVVVGHPVLEPILDEIRTASPGDDPAARARAIYDWTVDNVEYKKVGTGWGNGDTFWACTERYGNCTDFHSLFISLARTEGIPARFEMGFPVPSDRPEGRVAGYHCWVEFWLPDVGWTPIDASEAFKHPEKRELFYGTHPADRVHFSRGRDLRMGPRHRDRPLNYFIYPYAESGGQRADLTLTTRFHYRDLASEDEVAYR